uniref:Putative secreted protein n=1 Tax=Anopheles triannulatus TaxID=58253 RepID=A0A2M4B420_9DIPT
MTNTGGRALFVATLSVTPFSVVQSNTIPLHKTPPPFATQWWEMQVSVSYVLGKWFSLSLSFSRFCAHSVGLTYALALGLCALT